MVLFCWRVRGSLLEALHLWRAKEIMREWASEQQSLKGRRKGEFAMISNFHFCFTHTWSAANTISWTKGDWWHSLMTHHNACTFRNTMLTEIGNIMIAPYHSLLLRSVNDFWGGLCDLNPAELLNRQIRRLRKGCQENIMILNLTTFVVFPHN